MTSHSIDRVVVGSASGPYPVVIGNGAIATLGSELAAARLHPRRLLISSHRVWELHGHRFRHLGADRTPILVEDGERFKNLNTVARVFDALVKANADRSTVVIAVGGGVIGDLVGFAAATYLRGALVRGRTTRRPDWVRCCRRANTSPRPNGFFMKSSAPKRCT